MTEEDLCHIERELRIELPTDYRRTMLRFPVPAYAGNTDTELWDDAESLIEMNSLLRRGEYWAEPWQTNLFCLGMDAGGRGTALDLRESDVPVWWVDRGLMDATGQRFSEWLDTYTEGLEAELAELGLRAIRLPDVSPFC